MFLHYLQTMKNASFQIKCCMLLCKKTCSRSYSNYPTFIKQSLCAPNNIKIINKWNRAFSILLSAFTKSVVVSVGNSSCQQWKSFFDKHGIKANAHITGIYYCLKHASCYQTQCSRKYLFFKENSTSLHCACNTVQLLQQNKHLLLSYCPKQSSAEYH